MEFSGVKFLELDNVLGTRNKFSFFVTIRTKLKILAYMFARIWRANYLKIFYKFNVKLLD